MLPTDSQSHDMWKKKKKEKQKAISQLHKGISKLLKMAMRLQLAPYNRQWIEVLSFSDPYKESKIKSPGYAMQDVIFLFISI